MSCLSWSPGLIIGTLTLMLLIQANQGCWEAYLGDSVLTYHSRTECDLHQGRKSMSRDPWAKGVDYKAVRFDHWQSSARGKWEEHPG